MSNGVAGDAALSSCSFRSCRAKGISTVGLDDAFRYGQLPGQTFPVPAEWKCLWKVPLETCRNPPDDLKRCGFVHETRTAGRFVS
jgi:hypothetical protein